MSSAQVELPPHRAEAQCKKFALWVLTLVAGVSLAVPLCVLLGQSDFFLHHGASVWVQSNDAVFDLKNRTCKVLVFGDSTAMTGIDPSIVQQRTGLETCNISVTNAVLSVTDRLTLDHYLAHNHRPDVLVVQLSPESLQQDSESWRKTIYAEGLLELLRHAPAEQSRQILLQHPEQVLTFAGYVSGFTAWYGIKQVLRHTTGITLRDDGIAVRNGFFTPPAAARTHCEPLPDMPANEQSSAAERVVETYRQYQTNGTVLVNVAPIPACDRDLRFYQHELAGVTSNSLLAMPIQLFNDQRHYTASGSRVLSRMVSDQVNSVTGHVADDGMTIVSSLRPQKHHLALAKASIVTAER